MRLRRTNIAEWERWVIVRDLRAEHYALMAHTSAAAAAAELQPLIGSVKSGSLRVFGDWFGRPYDNIHTVRSAVAEGKELIVGFDGNERLCVDSPDDWEFSEHSFCIQRARRVVWTWFYYGREQTPENLFTQEHWVDDRGEIQVVSDANWYTQTFAPTKEDPAVELF